MGFSNSVDPSSKTCAKWLFLTFQPKAINDGMAPNVLEKGLLHSNYRKRAITTRGLYTFYPLFEVHLCTVILWLVFKSGF